MLPRKLFLFLLFVLGGTLGLSAQHQNAYQVIYPSKKLNEKRSVWISLPKYYEENEYTCHVVFHLDAQEINQSNTIRTIRDELFENGGYIQPVILVGIEQYNRRTELNPTGERGKQFTAFLLEELVPYIDSIYRTYPDRTISGHSLGGFYALHLWKEAKAIKNCFAFSPAIYNDDNIISEQLAEYLAGKPKGYVYFNHGDEGVTEKMILKEIPKLERAFRENASFETPYLYKYYKGYGHNFTHLVGFTDAMLGYFSRFSPPDSDIDALWDFQKEPIAYMDTFYNKLEDWLEFPIQRSPDLIANLIGTYLDKKDHQKAKEMADHIMNLDPENPYVLWSAASAYSAINKDYAKELLEKALLNFTPSLVFENSTREKTYDYLKELMIQEYLELSKE